MTQTSHFIGICGAGMSAVARLLKQRGDTVTGSDAGFYPPVSDYISSIGLSCVEGHSADNLPTTPDLIVIGRHAKLKRDINTEVAAAEDLYPDKIRSFPAVLGELTADRDRIVVAGSYGKSSVTSLITWCLLQAGKDPGWFIGAIPRGFDHSSDLGKAGPFVFEGDEYPSANFDDSAKFSHYSPHVVVLTSATHDHVNVYPTLADYHAPFQGLLMDLADRDGTLIACTDEDNAARFFHAFRGPKISYGLSPGGNFGATHIELGNPEADTPTTFALVCGIDTHPGFTTTEIGRHAVENIVAAAACLIGQRLLTVEEFRAGVASFGGLNRRLDRKIPEARVPVFEGFGSSKEKARAAIEAMSAHYPNRNIKVIFEPHTFTWRNRTSLSQYRDAFNGTAQVWIYAPPQHGATDHDQASLAEIVAETAMHHPAAQGFTESELDRLVTDLDPAKDVVLILTSGNFGGTLPAILSRIASF